MSFRDLVFVEPRTAQWGYGDLTGWQLVPILVSIAERPGSRCKIPPPCATGAAVKRSARETSPFLDCQSLFVQFVHSLFCPKRNCPEPVLRGYYRQRFQ